MRKPVYFLPLILIFLGASASADIRNPDVEGRISGIDTVGHEITVSNVLYDQVEKLGTREIRIGIDRGWINDFKLNDYVRIRLSTDKRTAVEAEKALAPEGPFTRIFTNEGLR